MELCGKLACRHVGLGRTMNLVAVEVIVSMWEVGWREQMRFYSANKLSHWGEVCHVLRI